MPHPAFRIIESAEPILRAIEGEFGFTPRADNDLTRVESFNAGHSQLRLPLDGGSQVAERKGEPEEDPLGLMNSADSAPPGSTVN